MKKAISIILATLLIVGLFISCQNNPNTQDELINARLVYSDSREIEANNPDYDYISYDNLYWEYKAVKADVLWTTGQTDGFVPMKSDNAPGLATSLGKFSKGNWKFYFRAYEEAEKQTLYFDAIETPVTLNSKNNIISVNVNFKQADGETGTINIGSLKKLVGETSEDFIASEDYHIVIKIGDNPYTDTDKKSITAEGFSISDINVGFYDVSVAFVDANSLDEIFASEICENVQVKANLTTTITGSVAEGNQIEGVIVTDIVTTPEGLITAIDTANTKANSVIFVKAGTYEMSESLEISKPMTIIGEIGLTNIVFPENTNYAFIVNEALSNEDLSLVNLNISGTLNIKGGGSNSIHLISTNVNNVILDKDTTEEGAEVPRLVLQKSTITNSINIIKEAIIEADTVSTIVKAEVKADLTVNGDGTRIEKLVLVEISDNSGTEIFVPKIEIGNSESKLPTNIATKVEDREGNIIKDETINHEASFAAKIANAENGETIVLTENLDNLTEAIQITKNITIDLNGKTVSSKGTNAFVVSGEGVNVTFTGNGTVKANKTSKSNVSAISVVEEAEVVIENGTYEGTFAVATGSFNKDNGEIKNGTLTINGGNFKSTEFTLPVWGSSKLTVNDGTFTATDNAVIGTNGSTPLSASSYDITVNGGTFNGNITSSGYIACGIYMANTGKVTLNGGEFNITGGIGILVRSGELVANNTIITLTDKEGLSSGKIGDSTVSLTAGFQIVIDDRAGYPNAPQVSDNKTAYPIVDIDGKTIVAKIGNKYFSSLTQAIDTSSDNDTITLIKDIELSESLIITNKNIILDMAGKNIYNPGQNFTRNIGYLFVLGDSECNTGITGSSLIINDSVGGSTIGGDYENADTRAFEIYDGSYLEINNGVTVQTFSYSGGAGIWAENSEVVINNAKFYSSGAAINIRETAKITINDGIFASIASNKMKNPETGDNLFAYTLIFDGLYEINGGTVYGVQGALANDGKGVINDITAIATKDIFTHMPDAYKNFYKLTTGKDVIDDNGEVFYAMYAAGEATNCSAVVNGGYFSSDRGETVLIGNSQDGGVGENSIMTINGGYFEQKIKVDQTNPNYGFGDLNITGGNFKDITSLDSYISNPLLIFSSTPNSDGYYTVEPLENGVIVEIIYNQDYANNGSDATNRIAAAQKVLSRPFSTLIEARDAVLQQFNNAEKNDDKEKYEQYISSSDITPSYTESATHGKYGAFYYRASDSSAYGEAQVGINSKVLDSVTYKIYGVVDAAPNDYILGSVTNPTDVTLNGINPYCKDITVVGITSDASITDITSINAIVAGGYNNTYRDSGTLTVKDLSFSIVGDKKQMGITASSSLGEGLSNDTGYYPKSTIVNIINCTFNGKMYIYTQDQYTLNRIFNIENCIFNGEDTSGNSLFMQQGPVTASEDKYTKMCGEINIKNNMFNSYTEGINIHDRPRMKVTINGNTFNGISNAEYKSAIQMTEGISYTIEDNTFKDVNCNIFRLHELLATDVVNWNTVEGDWRIIESIIIKNNIFENCKYMLLDEAGIDSSKFIISGNSKTGVANPTMGIKKGETYNTDKSLEEIEHNLDF